jgi:transposase
LKNTNKFVERHNQLEKHPIICSLDVHTSNIYMYALNYSTGEILADCNVLGGFKAVLKHLEKHQFSKKQTIILYEAGTFGFFPYRMFTKRGYSCKIIAPNSIPRKKNLKKTDRYDAIENANYHVSGNLRYVHIPSEQDEQARELLRYRFEQVWKITKPKQYIQAFLKRYGQVFEEGKSYWSKKHYRWLETIELPLITRRYLDLKLHDLGQLEKQLKTIEVMLDDIFVSDERYQSMSKIYSLIPGVGKINAMVLVLEGGDLKRFKKPTALMSYTGLVPGKYASGTSDPHLRITKTGNKYLRTTMVGGMSQAKCPLS